MTRFSTFALAVGMTLSLAFAQLSGTSSAEEHAKAGAGAESCVKCGAPCPEGTTSPST